MNNYSQFSYDGLWRNTKIVETTSGSVTSTKQFVWFPRQLKPSEERDGLGVLSKVFCTQGQLSGATKYFYVLDRLDSVREMVDASAATQAIYAYDPFGRVTKTSETVASSFGYCGYYLHARSGLNITSLRAYNPNLGRWINRDPIEELGGLNLYSYTGNKPIKYFDRSGLGTFIEFRFPWFWPWHWPWPKPKCDDKKNAGDPSRGSNSAGGPGGGGPTAGGGGPTDGGGGGPGGEGEGFPGYPPPPPWPGPGGIQGETSPWPDAPSDWWGFPGGLPGGLDDWPDWPDYPGDWGPKGPPPDAPPDWGPDGPITA